MMSQFAAITLRPARDHDVRAADPPDLDAMSCLGCVGGVLVQNVAVQMKIEGTFKVTRNGALSRSSNCTGTITKAAVCPISSRPVHVVQKGDGLGFNEDPGRDDERLR
jgi:hypothetical protein